MPGQDADIPTFIGRYRVMERLSSGGMGVLYLARDPAIDRTVAIKVARVHSVELRQRFLREARATGRLNHRNIVTLYDVGEHGGEPFIAMEYVPGRTLAAIIHRRTPLPLLRRLRILRELCDGLAYAHGQNIIHRDVKPANLIVRHDTGALKILDFGIARLQDALTVTSGAPGGTPGGTPHYMAPEQVAGADVDHRCDIFSVGLVCYELLSYRRAFDGDNATSVLYRVAHDEPAPLAGLAPELGSDLIAIVERALAKQPERRYQNLQDLLAELDTVIGRVEEEGGGRDSVGPVPADEEPTAATEPDSPSSPSRAELVARRDEELASSLEAARAALEKEHWDAAQTATERAALLAPHDDRVLRAFERIAAGRADQQLDEHLSIARGYLENLELTLAAESVESALVLQPRSPAGLELRREIQSRLTLNRHLERAEQGLASGEFTDALLSVHEALAVDEEHEAARTLKDRILAAASNRRAQAAVDEARTKQAAGDLAGAAAVLEGFGEAHDLVTAELATIRAEIKQQRQSFEAVVAQGRNHPERGQRRDTRDPRRRTLDAGDAEQPPTGEPGSPARPVEDVLFAIHARPPGSGDPRRRRMLVALLSSAALMVTIAVAGAGLTSLIDRQEPAPDPGRDVGADANVEGGTPANPSAASTPSAQETAPDAEDTARVDSDPPAASRASRSLPAAGPDAAGRAPGSSNRPLPAASPATLPDRQDVNELLAAAAAAEAAGDIDTALDRYAAVRGYDADNPTAMAGHERIQARFVESAAQEGLRAANAAFAAGRYDDARRLFQDALDRNASPAAAAGLRRVDNAVAVHCGDATACGTLVISVTPAAEIFVDDRSLGVAAELELSVPVGRHRIRLETAEWAFPRSLTIWPDETTEIAIDLEQDGFPKVSASATSVDYRRVSAAAPAAPNPAAVTAPEAASPALSPALSPEVMEEFLRTADLSDFRDVGEGITGTRRAVASDGRITHDVHVQTVDIRAPVVRVRNRVERSFRDSYAYNIAAYRLAVLLGMDNVPMSVERSVQSEPAAVTWWVDDIAMTERERTARRTYGPNPAYTVQQFYAMFVFDELIRNQDRNQGNVLWTSDWKMWLIDHTRAFRPQVEIGEPARLTHIGRRLLENLRQLSTETLEAATGEHLTGLQRSRVLERRDLLVRHFDERIARLGESAVLFDE